MWQGNEQAYRYCSERTDGIQKLQHESIWFTLKILGSKVTINKRSLRRLQRTMTKGLDRGKTRLNIAANWWFAEVVEGGRKERAKNTAAVWDAATAGDGTQGKTKDKEVKDWRTTLLRQGRQPWRGTEPLPFGVEPGSVMKSGGQS